MENLYVIKFDNGTYWCAYNTADKQLRKAMIYRSLKMAQDVAKDCMDRIKLIHNAEDVIDYKIVKVEIKEVDGSVEKI